MPLIDLNNATNWTGPDALYTTYDASGQLIGLRRAEFIDGFKATADIIVNALTPLGLTKGQRIAIVGAQFGWFAERLVELGYGPIGDGTAAGRIVCVDTSTWIQANKGSNANVTIISQDVNANTGRRAIKSQLGSPTITIDWCIDYMILPCLVGVGDVPGGNNEIVPYCSALRQVATNVVHVLTPLESGPPQQDARMNWKSMPAWKAWVTPDRVMHEGTGEIL